MRPGQAAPHGPAKGAPLRHPLYKMERPDTSRLPYYMSHYLHYGPLKDLIEVPTPNGWRLAHQNSDILEIFHRLEEGSRRGPLDERENPLLLVKRYRGPNGTLRIDLTEAAAEDPEDNVGAREALSLYAEALYSLGARDFQEFYPSRLFREEVIHDPYSPAAQSAYDPPARPTKDRFHVRRGADLNAQIKKLMAAAARLPPPENPLVAEAVGALVAERPFDLSGPPPEGASTWLTTQSAGRYARDERDYAWRPMEKPRILAQIPDAPWGEQNPVGRNLWVVDIEGHEYILNGALGVYVSRQWKSSVHFIKGPPA